MDIIVTTPKNKSKEAAQEADFCKSNGGGFYFRHFNKAKYPKQINRNSRVFYVEDGFVMGFCKVEDYGFIDNCGIICSTTGDKYLEGFVVIMDSTSWKWIKPVKMKGFQGFRYFKNQFEVEVVGDWLTSKPIIGKEYK